MTTADKLAQVIAEHGNWGWSADNDGPDTRIRCGCGADLGEVSDKNEEVQALEADALFAAHIAPVVLAHLTAEGWGKTAAEEWAIRRVGSSAAIPQPSKERALWLTEGPGLAGHPDEPVRRRVTDWEPADA